MDITKIKAYTLNKILMLLQWNSNKYYKSLYGFPILSKVPMLIHWQNIEHSGQNFNEEAQHEFPDVS